MSEQERPAIAGLDNKLTALAILLGAVAYFVLAAQQDADQVRRQLREARLLREKAEDAARIAKRDLDGALEQLHETAGERDELRARHGDEPE
jgi:predicted secreted protein